MNKYKIYLSVLIAAHFTLFFLTGLFRHWGFLTSINDLAHFDQAIWGTIHGNFLLNTDVFNMPTSRLAMHFDPIQLIFVPFYLIYPSVVWLIAGQSLALAITAWPIFLIAKRVLESESVALMWAGIFLVNPFIFNAAVWDFHPITLAVPFVATSMLAILKKSFKIILISIIPLFLCKEHLGIMVAGFGILWWIKNRQGIFSLFLVTLGLVHFYFVMEIIMPFFSGSDSHLMISKNSQLNRFGWIGGSLGEIFITLTTKPIYILENVYKSGGVLYIFLLLFPFLGLNLFSFEYFILPSLADLASNMLAASNLQRMPISYHSATLVPILTISAIIGVLKIKNLFKKISSKEISIFVIISSIIYGYWLAPVPLPGAINFWKPKNFFILQDHRVEDIKKLIGTESTISCQANIGAHFSQRKEIYLFPKKISEVDFIILWLESPTKKISGFENEKNIFYIGSLESHLQMTKKSFLIKIEELLEHPNYTISFWNDPWLVLKKNNGKEEKNDDDFRYDIKNKIKGLKKLYLSEY